MTTSGIRRLVDRFDPAVAIEDAWTPPAGWYTSGPFHEAERAAVFGRTWQPVVRADRIPSPGDVVSGCLAGMPWLVLRDADGVVRAFHNVCRHKGREVVVGSPHLDELVCGYHGWRYGLDGRLRSAPRMAGIRGFERENMSLVPLRAEIWGPWVFINGDADARPLRETVGELDSRLEASGWGQLQYHSSREWTISCNWKVYADNYLDGGYHIPHMHPTLDAQLDMESYRTEIFDEFSIQTSDPATAPDRRIDYDARVRIGPAALYAWIYPTFMINRYGPCMDSNFVIPLGPDRCRVVYDFFFESAAGDEALRFVEESIEQSDVTQREDIEICESVQVGLGSPAYDRGRYAPRVEVGEHHFHRLLHRDMSRWLDVR